MKNIMASILVLAYKHEKYIAEALNSILKQKTQYSYEIIVNEDASPDGTRIILQEYEKKYPDIITVVYRDINSQSIGMPCAMGLEQMAIGKYIILLEGDDFWISEDKLEKQISFLEENPEYVAVAHNCVVVDQNSHVVAEGYPECKDKIYTLKHFRWDILPGQTATIMYRADIYKQIREDEIWRTNPWPGDQILVLGTVSKGNIYCMQEIMSAYRHIVSGGTSYSSNVKLHFATECVWWQNVISFSGRLNNKKAEIAAESRYLAVIFFDGLLKNEITLFQACELYLYVNHKFKVFVIKIWDFFVRRYLVHRGNLL